MTEHKHPSPERRPIATRSFSSLVKSDYDYTTIKVAWMNVVISNNSNSNNSSSAVNNDPGLFRLYRAELKGSNLYLFKPTQNIRSFKLEEQEEGAELAPQLSHDENKLNSIHPNLQYDETTRTFTSYRLSLEPITPPGTNSIEAILHYILIYSNKEDNVDMFIELLPLLPDFGSILTLLANMLDAVYANKYGEVDLHQVVSRVLSILNNIDKNFPGYLLKSDIAPYILRIIEILTSKLKDAELKEINQFKTKMLHQQHKLIDLVGNNTTGNPLMQLNANSFLTLNIMELSRFISEIDLKFYSSWNPTIDKSLLVKQQLDTFYKKNPLVFNDTHIHYLSRLLINHILVEIHDYEFKARVLEKWIDLACLLDKLGDMNSWLGISSVIVSQPVLRLTKLWNHVSLDYIKLVRNDWSPVLFELDKNSFNDSEELHVIASRGLGRIYPKEKIIPYFGDLTIEVNNTVDIKELNIQMNNINYSLNRWHEYLHHIENSKDVLEYNNQVLLRYDNMGFIFSNESLNQVLYLGGDEPVKPIETTVTTRKPLHPELKLMLLKLVDINSDSMNMEGVMKLSLKLEPDLTECYLQESPKNHSTTSLNSIDSSDDPSMKLPNFNNSYFKINTNETNDMIISESSELQIDDELILKVTQNTTADGLGIDVEDILNGVTTSSDKFIPKYGTLDRLLDLLVCDSSWFIDSVKLDLQEYRSVFLLNYYAFISTHDLFEKLTYRFKHAENAVSSLRGQFPNWEAPVNENLTIKDYSKIMSIQINIIKALIVIINNFYHPNFTTDLSNRTVFTSLLKLINSTIVSYYTNTIHTEQFDNLIMYYKKLKQLYVKKSYRPIEQSKFDVYLNHEFKFNNSLSDVPINRNLPGHSNIHKIEKFLVKFNKFLFVFYKGITIEDWMKVYRILETMYYNNDLLNVDLQRNSTADEQLIISTVFTYLESLSDDTGLVIDRFPLVFQKLFKLYCKFKTYLLIQLSNITVEERLDRMKALLIMAKIANMKRKQFEFEGTCSTIPSFIETAITNVIQSRVSRSYSSLWIEASRQLNPAHAANYDDITSLFPNLDKSELNNDECLLPCFGWIIENLIEINRVPSYKLNMINFNKRHLVYKLIKELSIEDSDITKHDTREFDFLLRLDERVKFKVSMDNSNRLFRSLIREQKRILMTDNQKKIIKKSINSPTVMHSVAKKSSTNSLKRQSLKPNGTSSSNKFKLTGLFNRARPLLSSEQKILAVKDLPPPSIDNCQYKKPVVVPLRNRKIFPIYHMRHCFKLDSDVTNDSYLLQAVTEDDVNDWLIKLDYANRHWFMSRIMNSTVAKSVTFGIPLGYHGDCPKVLTILFDIIELGLDEVGIYRISCSTSELLNMKAYIDRYGTVERTIDTHTATSLVKAYFRELPDSIFTDEVINLLFEIRQNLTSEKLIEVLAKLPQANYTTLKTLTKHLSKVCENHEINKMTSSNLATVIAPALTESSHLQCLVNNFGFMNKIMDNLIEMYDDVFEG
ncbi:uncharacterized protein SPAPADRAFT_158219 [Spathaspora passalidarum NRRL Y-27907]|uniref:Rho-GAP domain-containing protein n=1 Tax=Spathaspora passalidarum (strain NRRL Y-27907 / 11-Y1) TaxID=619300 RepID=G3AVL6_SPAPN|nr:uncharacterized protein SPAPADRAFT_158219 [Spathaspora passalidarum NRRL Y-27907]EGW29965.1 hypothetical protein SPAPADRAFT_158219 [Spathaspora passalidarum NRRL Y-27907]